MSKERILIVDDEKNIVSSLTGILSDEGYEISTTGDGVEALEIIQKDPPDLVLLDIWLPGMDGIEFAKRLRANSETKNIPIIMLTAKSDEDNKIKGLDVGADDYRAQEFPNGSAQTVNTYVFKINQS